MQHPTARDLYQYWDRLRGNDRAPLRSALDPVEIRGILGDTFLLEVLGPGQFRFRLAGTRICGMYCRELKGLDFLEFWSPEDRPAMANLLTAVTTDAAAGSLSVTAWNDREQTVSLTGLFLPLRQKHNAFDRIVGVLAPESPPYWLGLHPIAGQQVAALSSFQPEVHGRVIALASPAPMAWDRMPPAERRERFLVVEGGRVEKT